MITINKNGFLIAFFFIFPDGVTELTATKVRQKAIFTQITTSTIVELNSQSCLTHKKTTHPIKTICVNSCKHTQNTLQMEFSPAKCDSPAAKQTS